MRIQRPRISQPVITSPTITEVTSLEGDGANITGSFSGSFDGTLTGPTSASFATRLGTIEGDNATQTELDAVSASLASDVSTNTTNHTTVSSSLATRVTTIEDDNATQTELDAVSSSLASSITANDISALNTFTSSFNTAMTLDSDNVTVLGNLTVQGTQTTLDTATLNVTDLNILVASGAADASAANGAGLTVDGASATLTYASTGDKWEFNKALDMGANTITTTGAIAGATLNTGQGANELYAMNQAVQTSDDVQFDSFGVGTAASGTAGEIRATGDITAFYSSDERLKENFKTLDGALDKVNQLNGYEFDWKDGIEDVVSKTGHDIGVKAQEVQALYPDLVHERDNGYLAVDYVKLTAVLLHAVKELSAKVDELSK